MEKFTSSFDTSGIKHTHGDCRRNESSWPYRESLTPGWSGRTHVTSLDRGRDEERHHGNSVVPFSSAAPQIFSPIMPIRLTPQTPMGSILAIPRPDFPRTVGEFQRRVVDEEACGLPLSPVPAGTVLHRTRLPVPPWVWVGELVPPPHVGSVGTLTPAATGDRPLRDRLGHPPQA